MKPIKYISLIALWLIAVAPRSAASDGWFELTVAEPGTFVSSFEATFGDTWDTIESLRIHGSLSGTDQAYVRRLSALQRIDLTDVEFENNELAYNTFSYMTNLKEAYLPGTLSTIAEGAFYYCMELEKVAFSGTPLLDLIGQNAFSGCSELVSFGCSKVKRIETSAFQQCKKFDAKIFRGVERFGSWNVFSNTATTEVPEGFFAEGVTEIADGLFNYCESLTKAYIPDGIRRIGIRAFSTTSSLTDVRWPSTLEALGVGAFENSAITEMVLPETIAYIGERNFQWCRNLQSLTCLAPLPPYVTDGYGFYPDVNVVQLYVPEFAVGAYREADIWNRFRFVRGLDVAYSRLVFSNPLTLTIDDTNASYFGSSVDVAMIVDTDDYWSSIGANVGQLTLAGDKPFNIGSLTVSTIEDLRGNLNHGMPTLINTNPAVKVSSMTVNRRMYRGLWYHISMPFDIAVADIAAPSMPTEYYKLRRYDAASRAAGNKGCWVDLAPGDKLERGKGYIAYIWQPLSYGEPDYQGTGVLSFTSKNASQLTAMLGGSDFTTALESHPSANASDRSWNHLGNPWPSFFDIRGLVDASGAPITAPVVLYREGSYGYRAFSPVDDFVALWPYEGFFMQAPDGVSSLTFKNEAQIHYTPAYQMPTPNIYAPAINTAEGRQVFDFNLDGEAFGSRARIVLNDEALMSYEVGRDAPRFDDEALATPYIYVEGDVNYDICERPFADGRATLALGSQQQAQCRLSLSGRHAAGWRVWLTDHLTGSIVDLAEGDYTFTTEPTAEATRFSVRFDNVDSGLAAPALTDDASVATVCDLTGVVLFRGPINEFHAPATGVYIVDTGSKVCKLLIKK